MQDVNEKNGNLDEKYKEEMVNHEKFQKLIDFNANLETQLEIANQKIQSLIKSFSLIKSTSSENLNSDQLAKRIACLEKQNYEITSQVNSLLGEVNYWQQESKTKEQLVIDWKSQLEKAKIDLASKVDCVDALKSKITEQHSEIQELFQNNAKLNNSTVLIQNELDCAKKSESWYRSQYRDCQNQKLKLSENITTLRSIIADKQEQINSLNAKVNKWRNKIEELQITFDFKQRSFTQKVEDLQNEIVAIKENQNSVSTCDIKQHEVKYYEQIVASLTKELQTVKQLIQEQKEYSEEISREKANLLSRCTVLQKSLNNKEIALETEINSKQDLNWELSKLTDVLKNEEQLIRNLAKEKTNLEVALSAANKEKAQIQTITSVLREDLTKFISNYSKLKDELKAKEKQVLQLENEKQHLFMNNNWKTCELENSSSRLTFLEKKIVDRNKSESCLLTTNIMLNEQNSQLQQKLQGTNEIVAMLTQENENKYSIINNHATEIASLKQQIDEMKQNGYGETLNMHQLKIVFENLSQILDNLNVTGYESKTTVCLENASLYCILKNINDCLHDVKESSRFCKAKWENSREVELENLNLKKVLYSRMQTFGTRCKYFEDVPKIKHPPIEEEGQSICDGICPQVKRNLNTKLKEIKLLVHVVELEQAEKQIRNDKYNRILLKSMKDQMNERKSSEKRCICLEESNDKLRQQLSEITVQNLSNQADLESLKLKCESLKETIFDLQTNLSGFEIDSKNLESKEISYQNNLQEKDSRIIDLKSKLQQIQCEYNELLTKYDNKINECEQLRAECEGKSRILSKTEKELETERKSGEKSCQELFLEKNRCLNLETSLETMRNDWKLSQKTNDLLTKQISDVNDNFNKSQKELQIICDQQQIAQQDAENKETHCRNLISNLQLDIQALQNELEYSRSDQFFLQRLCSDLKYALQSTTNQNKILRGQLSENTSDYSSVPDCILNLPSPQKFNDQHVFELLQQTNIVTSKPLSHLEHSLNLLKRDLHALRKNIHLKENGHLI